MTHELLKIQTANLTSIITHHCTKIGLMFQLSIFFLNLQLFRRLTLSNVRPSESSGDCKTKYKLQKNNSITVSPLKSSIPSRTRVSARKKDHRKHRIKLNDDDIDDDFTVSTARGKRSYLKNCIKKRLNNNYEKQINCLQDENVVYTDNKIYVSLAARNSSQAGSLSGNSFLKKNRRIIYPTSCSHNLNGFLRDYDFNYESPTRSIIGIEEEQLQFNVMRRDTSLLNNVVFEKVKLSTKNEKSPAYNRNDASSLFIHVTNTEEDRNEDSILTNSTFLAECNNCDLNSFESGFEDDALWKKFFEVRKHVNSSSSEQAEYPSESVFDSEMLSSSNAVDKDLRSFETWRDNETYDNLFNEELEQRVSIMFPNSYENNNTQTS